MKLFPHVILPTPEALEWCRRSGLVKAMDRVDPLQAAQPNAVLIWRQSYANEGDTSDPLATVARSIAGLKGFYSPFLYLQLWTGAHPRRAELKLAVAECHRLGYKTVGSSWFTGDYTQQDWNDATDAGVDMYGPQAYWGTAGLTVDHALRYRQFWKPGQKPVVILEAGRDAIEGGRGGWMRDSISGEAYLAELLAYNAELEKDAYVLGATVFTSGPTPGNPPSGWDPFNVDPISARLPSSKPPVIPTPGGTPVTPPITPTYSSPNHSGPRATTNGVVIHSTRGGSMSTFMEYMATVAWFNNPTSQVSAHCVVGPSLLAYPVDPANIAWHAKKWNNTHLGIELCQPHLGDQLDPNIVEAAAQIVAGWCKRYHIPIIWDATHGLVEHWEIDSAKSDISAPFDRADFLARVKRYAGGNVAGYVVGAGVLALMAKYHDTPQSDENYIVNTHGDVFKSETFGAQGIYTWNKQANKTVLIPYVT